MGAPGPVRGVDFEGHLFALVRNRRTGGGNQLHRWENAAKLYVGYGQQFLVFRVPTPQKTALRHARTEVR